MSFKKKVVSGFILIAALMLVVEILWAEPHHHQIWNTLPGADIIIGFCGGWIFICLSKIILNKLIRRPEDYYEKSSSFLSPCDQMPSPVVATAPADHEALHATDTHQATSCQEPEKACPDTATPTMMEKEVGTHE